MFIIDRHEAAYWWLQAWRQLHIPLHLLLSLFRNSPHHHQNLVAVDQADARTQPSQSLDYKWSELKANGVAFSTSEGTLNLWEASVWLDADIKCFLSSWEEMSSLTWRKRQKILSKLWVLWYDSVWYVMICYDIWYDVYDIWYDTIYDIWYDTIW